MLQSLLTNHFSLTFPYFYPFLKSFTFLPERMSQGINRKHKATSEVLDNHIITITLSQSHHHNHIITITLPWQSPFRGNHPPVAITLRILYITPPLLSIRLHSQSPFPDHATESVILLLLSIMSST